MARPPEPVFLERQNYRRRRIGDASKLMPFFGLVLVLLPVLWADVATTAGGMIYLFVVWALLIAVSGFLSRVLTASEPSQDEAGDLSGGED
jgi:hypothetical protein